MKVTPKMMENLTGMVADVAAIERERLSDSSLGTGSVSVREIDGLIKCWKIQQRFFKEQLEVSHPQVIKDSLYQRKSLVNSFILDLENLKQND